MNTQTQTIQRGQATTATNPAAGSPFRWVVAILLLGHGLIHALGTLEIWGLADLEQLTGQPSYDIGPTATNVLAASWPIALVVLVAAGLALLKRRAWWRPLAVFGIGVSQFAIVIWWGDASAGTIPNLLAVAAVIFAGRSGLRFEQRGATR